MFFLSLEERVELARFIKEKAAGRVPVVASGHISDMIEDQAEELNAVAGTGVNAGDSSYKPPGRQKRKVKMYGLKI